MAPWLSQLVTFGPHVASFIARPGFVLCWPCPCGRRITASDSGRLDSARRNHITRAHEGEDRANFPVIQHRVNTELAELPPGAPVSWRCSKCMRAIPAGNGSYTHTALAHLQSCPGAPKTLKANNQILRKAARLRGLPALSGSADGNAKGLFYSSQTLFGNNVCVTILPNIALSSFVFLAFLPKPAVNAAALSDGAARDAPLLGALAPRRICHPGAAGVPKRAEGLKPWARHGALATSSGSPRHGVF